MFTENIGFKLHSQIRAEIDNITSYPAHVHPNALEMILVLKGQVRISDTVLKHRLSPGDIHIFNMGDPHEITSITKDNLILFVEINLNYYKKFFKGIDKSSFVCDTLFRKDRPTSQLFYIQFLLAKAYFSYIEEPVKETTMEKQAKDILSFLLEQFQYYTYNRGKGDALSMAPLKDIRPDDPYFLRIYNIIDYIYDHCTEKLRLEDIAEKEFLSVYYLSRYIKKACGLSFSDLLSLARCEYAQRLLGSTHDTVDQIASLSGFANRKHLGTQFQKWFHMTPSEYRKSLANQYGNPNEIIRRPFDWEEAERILNEEYLM